ncbi:MAG: hypothetical protein AAFR35_05880 [Pseudomonadota bacterium]
MRTLLILAASAVAFASALPAAAQNRPNRAAMQTAMQEMGVTRSDMRSCMQSVPRPAVQGQPTDAERQASGEALYSCLNAANPSLTPEVFRSAMSQLRPGG